MAWIRQKQCLNCGETYDVDVKICPHCNVESKDIFQNKYWEQTIWYKMVDCRILTQKELEKIHRRKNKRIRYDDNWFDPRTWLYRDGSRYNEQWKDIEWYNEMWIDDEWYNRKWFNPITRRHRNGSFYDDEWYDIEWYNENWYDRDWHPRGRDPVKAQEAEKARREEIIKQLWHSNNYD